jgi:patatin-like phospholipase/acyl hydrolase
MANQYNIVCFCGGGIRGLLSATILENLATNNAGILKYTDLFAGTSTGSGIISMLLAKPAYTPTDIVNYFLNEEVTYFGGMSQLLPTSPMYSVNEAYEGQIKLRGYPSPPLSTFLPQGVLFTAFNVGSYDESTSTGTAWGPTLFSNLSYAGNSDTTIAEAVTSSCAMPGMMDHTKATSTARLCTTIRRLPRSPWLLPAIPR